jgi:hydrogenase expression/formation protein HypE
MPAPKKSAGSDANDNSGEIILLAHGEGGSRMQSLIRDRIVPYLDNPIIESLPDAATLEIEGSRIAFTTDSFVVSPPIFPGGDIGSLAINGTVNDLATAGAKPLYISCAFILEEGLEIQTLDRVIKSLAGTARQAGVEVVTGDTKVVEKGSGDKIFITTTGIGLIEEGIHLSPDRLEEGDSLIVSSPIGEHGLAILMSREEFELDCEIRSDSTPLNLLTEEILKQSEGIKFMRDPTRGGLGGILVEIAGSGRSLEIREADIPIKKDVKAVCQILGLDPLYIANEGVMLIGVDPSLAEDLIKRMKKHPLGRNACVIGKVVPGRKNEVSLVTVSGGRRRIEMPEGIQYPRIC